MLRYLKYLLPMLFAITAKAQVNLVPNGSFEDHDPIQPDSNIVHFSDCHNWYSPTGGSPDYFSTFVDDNSPVLIPNNVAGNQTALDGNFYAGIFVYNKSNNSLVEYLQVKLIEPLQPQKKYQLEFYVSLADSTSWYALNNIGGLFTYNPIIVPQTIRLMYTPQIINTGNNPLDDKMTWIKVGGEFLATGEEKYLTIGNFNSPENDDTLYTPGGDIGNNGMRSYLYVDFVSLVMNDEVGINEASAQPIKIYPNPASNFVSISLPQNQINSRLSIYNLTGQLVAQKPITSTQIPITELGNGMYIFVITANDKVISRQRVVVAR